MDFEDMFIMLVLSELFGLDQYAINASDEYVAAVEKSIGSMQRAKGKVDSGETLTIGDIEDVLNDNWGVYLEALKAGDTRRAQMANEMITDFSDSQRQVGYAVEFADNKYTVTLR